jgi:hypothetical protein
MSVRRPCRARHTRGDCSESCKRGCCRGWAPRVLELVVYSNLSETDATLRVRFCATAAMTGFRWACMPDRQGLPTSGYVTVDECVGALSVSGDPTSDAAVFAVHRLCKTCQFCEEYGHRLGPNQLSRCQTYSEPDWRTACHSRSHCASAAALG